MRYYRNVDYFIYFEEFPHMGIPGVITANSDGTANIYINTLYTPARQRAALKHELRHLVRQHQYCDWMTLGEKEAEADDENDPSYIFGENFSYAEYLPPPEPPRARESAGDGAPPRLPDVFREKPQGTIPFFASLDALREYMFGMRKQYAQDREAARSI